jgi:RHS repeat-associated protein
LNSTLAVVPSGLWNYDNNDRLATDTYDNDGNTTWSAGIQNVYDFENHLIQHGAITYQYDGDGNRVSKTLAGVTTYYLVDTENPTGYAQVVDEITGTSIVKHTYGLTHLWQHTGDYYQGFHYSFYGYDGHGSVRYLTDPNGTVTDTYDYDAYGNLINRTGTTDNNYLFAGEQFDPDLGLYYNRARYLDVRMGRFWGMDTWEGRVRKPHSHHKFLYVSASPTNRTDPSGHAELEEEMVVAGEENTIGGMEAELQQQAGQIEDLASQAGEDIESEAETTSRQLDWREAENATKEEIDAPPNQEQPRINTSQGPRKLDAYNPETDAAAEAKSGRVHLNESTWKQIDKDGELLKTGGSEEYPIKSYEWHFWRSPYTGLVGPDADVAEKLLEHGIKIVIHY